MEEIGERRIHSAGLRRDQRGGSPLLWIVRSLTRERTFKRFSDGVLDLAAHDPEIQQEPKRAAEQASQAARRQLRPNRIEPLHDEIDDRVQLCGSDCGARGQGHLGSGFAAKRDQRHPNFSLGQCRVRTGAIDQELSLDLIGVGPGGRERLIDDGVCRQNGEMLAQELLAVSAAKQEIVFSEIAAQKAAEGAERAALQGRFACFDGVGVGWGDGEAAEGTTAHERVETLAQKARLREGDVEEAHEDGPNALVITWDIRAGEVAVSHWERSDSEDGCVCLLGRGGIGNLVQLVREIIVSQPEWSVVGDASVDV